MGTPWREYCHSLDIVYNSDTSSRVHTLPCIKIWVPAPCPHLQRLTHNETVLQVSLFLSLSTSLPPPQFLSVLSNKSKLKMLKGVDQAAAHSAECTHTQGAWVQASDSHQQSENFKSSKGLQMPVYLSSPPLSIFCVLSNKGRVGSEGNSYQESYSHCAGPSPANNPGNERRRRGGGIIECCIGANAPCNKRTGGEDYNWALGFLGSP